MTEIIFSDQKIEQTWGRNYRHYLALGYGPYSYGEIFLVNPHDLPKQSNKKVNVMCPVCKEERSVSRQSLYLAGEHSVCKACSKINDIAGEKFGSLTAISYVKTENGQATWRFACDCGREYIGPGAQVKAGNISSCGCSRIVDESGNTYGRLSVVDYAGPNHGASWLCECECGNMAIINGSDLRSGRVNSCGCLRIELMSGENNRFYKSSVSKEKREAERAYFGSWRSLVINLYGSKCVICQKKNDIHVHHLYDFCSYSSMRGVPKNGIPLCNDHHREFHIDYMNGWMKSCSPNDFLTWLELNNITIDNSIMMNIREIINE